MSSKNLNLAAAKSKESIVEIGRLDRGINLQNLKTQQFERQFLKLLIEKTYEI